VLILCLCGMAEAAQDPAPDEPVSVARIRERLAKTSSGVQFDRPVQLPVTFRSGVEQRVYVPTLKQWLQKEFELTPIQRQSADWAARCCGIALNPLFEKVEEALQRQRVRRTREQIRREIGDIEAARAEAGLSDPR
jgi:hypothetical protein